ARPDATGAIAATLELGDLQVALAGQGVAPGQLVIDPTGADLGAVVDGASSDAKTFTIRNGGGGPTGTLSVALAGTGAGQYQLVADACSGTTLASTASCTGGGKLPPRAAGGAAGAPTGGAGGGRCGRAGAGRRRA